MSATVTKQNNVESNKNASDEKKNEEINMMSELDELFEEYRTIEDLDFDVTRQQKLDKLNTIKTKISSIIESIEQRYPYKQTLNIKTTQLMNEQNNKNKNKNKSKKGNNNNNKNQNNDKKDNNNNSNNNNESVVASLSSLSTQYHDQHQIGINEQMNMDSTAIISRAAYLYFVGRYYKICNNLEIASPLLMESIKLDPELIECWNTLGDIYYIKGEMLAAKFCFESALEYDRFNKLSYISLSKILRKPTGKDQMEIMENCVQSLILAKQALKYGKKSGESTSSSSKKKVNALKDGELWFNLGNAYLMCFLNCINGWKLESSIKLEEKDKENNNKDKEGKDDNKDNDIPNKKITNKSSPNNKKNKPATKDIDDMDDGLKQKQEIKNLLNGLDDNFFSEEYEQENIGLQLRREIETELNDDSNNLLYHVYIRKCLSAYKCASTKCTINKHQHHPDLYCNRSHIHIYQENYNEALQDLKLSIKYSQIDDNNIKNKGDGGESNLEENKNGECQAKIMHDELLPKLCKISKQIGNRGGNKMQKKISNFCIEIKKYMKQCSDYYTRQLHYDLVDFNKLSNGLNGGNVIVLKIMGLAQPANQLPLHFICCDNNGSMFVLSFYLRGHALNHIYKIINQPTIINPSTLISVANPVKRHIKFIHGSKNIDFHTISFQKPQDICIGGKFFFNQ